MTDSFWLLLFFCALTFIGQAPIKSLVLSKVLPYLFSLALTSLCILTAPSEYPKSIWNSTFPVLNSTILYLKLSSMSYLKSLKPQPEGHPRCVLAHNPISNHPDLPILPPKYFSNHPYSYSFIISHGNLVTTAPVFSFSCHYYYWSSRSLVWHSTCNKDNLYVFIKGGGSETPTNPCLKLLSFIILLVHFFFY